MKKTFVAAVAIVAAVIIVLAAAVALLQYQPGPSSGSGKLSVMGTDPPVHSEEVRNASAHYNSVSAHKAGSDMSSGWVQVQGSGTLSLFASNSAEVMAVSQVNSGAYDAFRFNIDSVQVNYNGQTYAAAVASTTVTAESQSMVQVNSSSSATAVVDLRTFIINTGTTSNPQLIFSATAVATAVPPQTSISLSLTIGSTVDLSAQAWWSGFLSQTSTNVQLTGTVTTSSFNLNLQNSGSANAQIQEIIITPVSATAQLTGTLPASLSGSAVFTVSGSGTVEQSSSFQASALLSGGTTIASGSSTSLTFSGNGSLVAGGTAVVPGQTYIVTCIGANTYASTTVVAS